MMMLVFCSKLPGMAVKIKLGIGVSFNEFGYICTWRRHMLEVECYMLFQGFYPRIVCLNSVLLRYKHSLPPSMLKSPTDVLRFWFGDSFFVEGIQARNNMTYAMNRMPLWFMASSPEFDAVQLNNTPLLNELEVIHKENKDDENNEWNSPSGTLAKILVFDQFSRSAFRGTATAFKYDEYTKECVDHILKNNWLFKHYSVVERQFILVALQHHESIEAQTTGLELSQRIADDVDDEPLKAFYKEWADGFQQQHHDVVARFGRFPGRNNALVSVYDVMFVGFDLIIMCFVMSNRDEKARQKRSSG